MIANIRALPVTLGRVVDFKEELGKVFIISFIRVEDDFDGFSVAGCARADLFICGIFGSSAHIAGCYGNDARSGLEPVIYAPETAAREIGLCGRFAVWVIWVVGVRFCGGDKYE